MHISNLRLSVDSGILRVVFPTRLKWRPSGQTPQDCIVGHVGLNVYSGVRVNLVAISSAVAICTRIGTAVEVMVFIEASVTESFVDLVCDEEQEFGGVVGNFQFLAAVTVDPGS